MENKDKFTYHGITKAEIQELDDYMKKLNEEPPVKKLTPKEIEENHKVNFVKDLEEIHKWEELANQKLTARQIDNEKYLAAKEKIIWKMPPIDKVIGEDSAKKLNDEENLNKELKNLDEDIETLNKLNEFGEKESVYEYKLGRVNQSSDIRPREHLNAGQHVKLTEQGKIILCRYDNNINNIDMLGVFYIDNIYYKQSYEGREVRYDINQGNQRLSFYDNNNICLESLTRDEAIKLNEERRKVLHGQNAHEKERGGEAVKYQYTSQYNYKSNNYYYEYGSSEEDNKNLREWAKSVTVKQRFWDNPLNEKSQEKRPRGHALTKIFQ